MIVVMGDKEGEKKVIERLQKFIGEEAVEKKKGFIINKFGMAIKFEKSHSTYADIFVSIGEKEEVERGAGGLHLNKDELKEMRDYIDDYLKKYS